MLKNFKIEINNLRLIDEAPSDKPSKEEFKSYRRLKAKELKDYNESYNLDSEIKELDQIMDDPYDYLIKKNNCSTKTNNCSDEDKAIKKTYLNIELLTKTDIFSHLISSYIDDIKRNSQNSVTANNDDYYSLSNSFNQNFLVFFSNHYQILDRNSLCRLLLTLSKHKELVSLLLLLLQIIIEDNKNEDGFIFYSKTNSNSLYLTNNNLNYTIQDILINLISIDSNNKKHIKNKELEILIENLFFKISNNYTTSDFVNMNLNDKRRHNTYAYSILFNKNNNTANECNLPMNNPAVKQILMYKNLVIERGINNDIEKTLKAFLDRYSKDNNEEDGNSLLKFNFSDLFDYLISIEINYIDIFKKEITKESLINITSYLYDLIAYENLKNNKKIRINIIVMLLSLLQNNTKIGKYNKNSINDKINENNKFSLILEDYLLDILKDEKLNSLIFKNFFSTSQQSVLTYITESLANNKSLTYSSLSKIIKTCLEYLSKLKPEEVRKLTEEEESNTKIKKNNSNIFKSDIYYFNFIDYFIYYSALEQKTEIVLELFSNKKISPLIIKNTSKIKLNSIIFSLPSTNKNIIKEYIYFLKKINSFEVMCVFKSLVSMINNFSFEDSKVSGKSKYSKNDVKYISHILDLLRKIIAVFNNVSYSSSISNELYTNILEKYSKVFDKINIFYDNAVISPNNKADVANNNILQVLEKIKNYNKKNNGRTYNKSYDPSILPFGFSKKLYTTYFDYLNSLLKFLYRNYTKNGEDNINYLLLITSNSINYMGESLYTDVLITNKREINFDSISYNEYNKKSIYYYSNLLKYLNDKSDINELIKHSKLKGWELTALLLDKFLIITNENKKSENNDNYELLISVLKEIDINVLLDITNKDEIIYIEEKKLNNTEKFSPKSASLRIMEYLFNQIKKVNQVKSAIVLCSIIKAQYDKYILENTDKLNREKIIEELKNGGLFKITDNKNDFSISFLMFILFNSILDDSSRIKNYESYNNIIIEIINSNSNISNNRISKEEISEIIDKTKSILDNNKNDAACFRLNFIPGKKNHKYAININSVKDYYAMRDLFEKDLWKLTYIYLEKYSSFKYQNVYLTLLKLNIIEFNTNIFSIFDIHEKVCRNYLFLKEIYNKVNDDPHDLNILILTINGIFTKQIKEYSESCDNISVNILNENQYLCHKLYLFLNRKKIIVGLYTTARKVLFELSSNIYLKVILYKIFYYANKNIACDISIQSIINPITDLYSNGVSNYINEKEMEEMLNRNGMLFFLEDKGKCYFEKNLVNINLLFNLYNITEVVDFINNNLRTDNTEFIKYITTKNYESIIEMNNYISANQSSILLFKKNEYEILDLNNTKKLEKKNSLKNTSFKMKELSSVFNFIDYYVKNRNDVKSNENISIMFVDIFFHFFINYNNTNKKMNDNNVRNEMLFDNLDKIYNESRSTHNPNLVYKEISNDDLFVKMTIEFLVKGSITRNIKNDKNEKLNKLVSILTDSIIERNSSNINNKINSDNYNDINKEISINYLRFINNKLLELLFHHRNEALIQKYCESMVLLLQNNNAVAINLIKNESNIYYTLLFYYIYIFTVDTENNINNEIINTLTSVFKFHNNKKTTFFLLSVLRDSNSNDANVFNFIRDNFKKSCSISVIFLSIYFKYLHNTDNSFANSTETTDFFINNSLNKEIQIDMKYNTSEVKLLINSLLSIRDCKNSGNIVVESINKLNSIISTIESINKMLYKKILQIIKENLNEVINSLIELSLKHSTKKKIDNTNQNNMIDVNISTVISAIDILLNKNTLIDNIVFTEISTNTKLLLFKVYLEYVEKLFANNNASYNNGNSSNNLKILKLFTAQEIFDFCFTNEIKPKNDKSKNDYEYILDDYTTSPNYLVFTILLNSNKLLEISTLMIKESIKRMKKNDEEEIDKDSKYKDYINKIFSYLDNYIFGRYNSLLNSSEIPRNILLSSINTQITIYSQSSKCKLFTLYYYLILSKNLELLLWFDYSFNSGLSSDIFLKTDEKNEIINLFEDVVFKIINNDNYYVKAENNDEVFYSNNFKALDDNGICELEYCRFIVIQGFNLIRKYYNSDYNDNKDNKSISLINRNCSINYVSTYFMSYSNDIDESKLKKDKDFKLDDCFIYTESNTKNYNNNCIFSLFFNIDKLISMNYKSIRCLLALINSNIKFINNFKENILFISKHCTSKNNEIISIEQRNSCLNNKTDSNNNYIIDYLSSYDYDFSVLQKSNDKEKYKNEFYEYKICGNENIYKDDSNNNNNNNECKVLYCNHIGDYMTSNHNNTHISKTKIYLLEAKLWQVFKFYKEKFGFDIITQSLLDIQSKIPISLDGNDNEESMKIFFNTILVILFYILNEGNSYLFDSIIESLFYYSTNSNVSNNNNNNNNSKGKYTRNKFIEYLFDLLESNILELDIGFLYPKHPNSNDENNKFNIKLVNIVYLIFRIVTSSKVYDEVVDYYNSNNSNSNKYNELVNIKDLKTKVKPLLFEKSFVILSILDSKIPLLIKIVHNYISNFITPKIIDGFTRYHQKSPKIYYDEFYDIYRRFIEKTNEDNNYISEVMKESDVNKIIKINVYFDEITMNMKTNLLTELIINKSSLLRYYSKLKIKKTTFKNLLDNQDSFISYIINPELVHFLTNMNSAKHYISKRNTNINDLVFRTIDVQFTFLNIIKGILSYNKRVSLVIEYNSSKLFYYNFIKDNLNLTLLILKLGIIHSNSIIEKIDSFKEEIDKLSSDQLKQSLLDIIKIISQEIDLNTENYINDIDPNDSCLKSFTPTYVLNTIDLVLSILNANQNIMLASIEKGNEYLFTDTDYSSFICKYVEVKNEKECEAFYQNTSKSKASCILDSLRKNVYSNLWKAVIERSAELKFNCVVDDKNKNNDTANLLIPYYYDSVKESYQVVICVDDKDISNDVVKEYQTLGEVVLNIKEIIKSICLIFYQSSSWSLRSLLLLAYPEILANNKYYIGMVKKRYEYINSFINNEPCSKELVNSDNELYSRYLNKLLDKYNLNNMQIDEEYIFYLMYLKYDMTIKREDTSITGIEGDENRVFRLLKLIIGDILNLENNIKIDKSIIMDSLDKAKLYVQKILSNILSMNIDKKMIEIIYGQNEEETENTISTSLDVILKEFILIVEKEIENDENENIFKYIRINDYFNFSFLDKLAHNKFSSIKDCYRAYLSKPNIRKALEDIRNQIYLAIKNPKY